MKCFSDLVRDVVARQLPQHVVGHPVHDGLASVAGLAAHALLRLHGQDGVQDAFRGVDLENIKIKLNLNWILIIDHF